MQATGHAHLPQASPSPHTRPGRGFSPDERHVGLLTVRRQRRTARGVQPRGAVPPVFAWLSVDGAVEPTPGARFVLARPSLHAERCPLVVKACAPAFPESRNLLLLDNRGAQTAAQLPLAENVRRLFRPPSGPALNPSARVWRDLHDDSAWRQCADLEAHQDALTLRLQGDEAATLQPLTGYPSLVAAIHALHV